MCIFSHLILVLPPPYRFEFIFHNRLSNSSFDLKNVSMAFLALFFYDLWKICWNEWELVSSMSGNGNFHSTIDKSNNVFYYEYTKTSQFLHHLQWTNTYAWGMPWILQSITSHSPIQSNVWIRSMKRHF